MTLTTRWFSFIVIFQICNNIELLVFVLLPLTTYSSMETFPQVETPNEHTHDAAIGSNFRHEDASGFWVAQDYLDINDKAYQ